MCFGKSIALLECKVGSGTPLYLMIQNRKETEVTKLSQNNLFIFTMRMWSEQLYAYNCYWNVTEHSITSGHRIVHKI